MECSIVLILNRLMDLKPRLHTVCKVSMLWNGQCIQNETLAAYKFICVMFFMETWKLDTAMMIYSFIMPN